MLAVNADGISLAGGRDIDEDEAAAFMMAEKRENAGMSEDVVVMVQNRELADRLKQSRLA